MYVLVVQMSGDGTTHIRSITSINSIGLSGPKAVVLSSVTNDIYILDSTNNRLCQITNTLSFVRSINTVNGTALNAPTAIAFDSTSTYLFLSDTTNNRVVQLTSNLTYVASVTLAYGWPKLSNPVSQAQIQHIDTDGNVRVTAMQHLISAIFLALILLRVVVFLFLSLYVDWYLVGFL